MSAGLRPTRLAMDLAGFSVFIRNDGGEVEAAGVARMPRYRTEILGCLFCGDDPVIIRGWRKSVLRSSV